MGYDFIRSFAILVVFFGHIIDKQSSNDALLLFLRSLSPGLTMSLLGFISAVLISKKYTASFGANFLIKRLSRIYISLFVCLTFLSLYLLFLGKDVINQHSVLHYMGLSFFFTLFGVKSISPLGSGLWFITGILFMYLLFPFFGKLLCHRRGLAHLLVVISSFTFLDYKMYGTESIWNVTISFSLGIYVGFNDKIKQFEKGNTFAFVLAPLLLILCALATIRIIPYEIRGLLFAFYPIAFVPLLFDFSSRLPRFFISFMSFFAVMSYEFYILHFYFINSYFKEIFPNVNSLLCQIAISFVITFCLSYILSKGSARIRSGVVRYLLVENPARGNPDSYLPNRVTGRIP